MFGKKKDKNKFGIFEEKKEILEANVSHVEKIEQQILEDVAQVKENTTQVMEHATFNVSTEISLIQTLEELTADQAKAYADYVAFCENVVSQAKAGVELIEQNKRLTSPSKYLNEVPGALRAKNKQYETYLNEMNEANVQEQIALLRAELNDSYKDIQELEDTIHHLMGLLMESNKAATKLVMKFAGYEKLVKTTSMRDFSEDLAEIKDEVMGLRNTDEEISKCAERSKLQTEDVQEEMLAIKKEIAEIESDISYLMDVAEQKAE